MSHKLSTVNDDWCLILFTLCHGSDWKSLVIGYPKEGGWRWNWNSSNFEKGKLQRTQFRENSCMSYIAVWGGGCYLKVMLNKPKYWIVISYYIFIWISDESSWYWSFIVVLKSYWSDMPAVLVQIVSTQKKLFKLS